MPFNGAGVFQRVRNWVADATAGIKIRADYHDSEDDGFAAGLTNCITKDGQTIITQNIPFNSKRATGLADPVNPQDAATKAYADLKLAKTGETMTGDLVIKKDAPKLTLDDTDAAGATIIGRKNDKDRWLMRLGNDEVETGSHAGSNFELYPYADDGTLGGRALQFKRASGLGVVIGDPTEALGIVTKQYADAAANPRVLRAGDTMTGQLVSANSGVIQGAGTAGSITVNAAANHAAMSFHIPTVFLANFGMDSFGDFYMGGGSHGPTAYKFWTTKNLPAQPVSNARLAMAGDISVGAGLTEPFGGAAVTGVGVPSSLTLVVRWRYLQLFTTSWFTIGYA